ncbi:MAG: carbohydrate kinase family protein [Anaerolineae bacterium]|nr:carbohydrate kinase family protein [Anaerolineae bacterium]
MVESLPFDLETGSNRENHCDVVVAGAVCLDVIPLFGQRVWGADNLFAPGRVVEIGPAAVATGGPVSNTGQGLHRLGTRVCLQGKVGNDLFGQALVRYLAAEGLDKGLVVLPQESTSYTLVISPPGVDRIFFHCRGANDTFGVGDVRYEMLDRARLFHLGYPPLMHNLYSDGGAQMAAIFARAKARGVATSLDMSMPDPASPSGKVDWAVILERTLPHVDYLLPSAEEILFMLHRARFDALSAAAQGRDLLGFIGAELLSEMAGQLLGMGAAVVGIKCGQRGFYMRTADQKRLERCGRGRPADTRNWASRELWEPSFHVKVASAVGAGDATIAGFLSALLRGRSVEQTLKVACAVGACSVEVLDATGGVRSWEETIARIAHGWPKNPLEIPVPGWHYDDEGEVWHGPVDILAS